MTNNSSAMANNSSGMARTLCHCGPRPAIHGARSTGIRHGSRIESGMTNRPSGMTSSSSGMTSNSSEMTSNSSEMTSNSSGMANNSSGKARTLCHCGPRPAIHGARGTGIRHGSRIESGMTNRPFGMTSNSSGMANNSSGMARTLCHCGPRPAIHGARGTGMTAEAQHSSAQQKPSRAIMALAALGPQVPAA